MARQGLGLSLLLISAAFMLVGNGIMIGYGQEVQEGLIGQTVGNSKVQFYVSDVKATVNAGIKTVDVSLVLKNIGNNSQQFYPGNIRLVDSQSRQYQPQYPFYISDIHLPPGDTLAWTTSFRILPSNNFSKIYFDPDISGFSGSRVAVDLTNIMNPLNNPPASDWILSPNKGVNMSNKQLKITINDERYSGKTYLVDVTITNLGELPELIGPGNFVVKDAEGMVLRYNSSYDLTSPLLGVDLPPGEKVRGDIAFDADKRGGNVMIIYNGGRDVPLLNTGSLPIQNVSKLN